MVTCAAVHSTVQVKTAFRLWIKLYLKHFFFKRRLQNSTFPWHGSFWDTIQNDCWEFLLWWASTLLGVYCWNYSGKQTKTEKNWSKYTTVRLLSLKSSQMKAQRSACFVRKLRSWSCLYHAKDKVIEEQTNLNMSKPYCMKQTLTLTMRWHQCFCGN